MMKSISFPVLALVLATSACAPRDQYGGQGGVSSDSMGSVIGGIAGGFLGSQFGEGGGKIAASVAGALVGAWAGQQIAQNLTRSDRRYYNEAAEQAKEVPVGQTIEWYNPQTGHQGSITPTREGQTQSGNQYCREFQQTVTIDGQTERAYGTACRQPDGTWKIVN